MKFYLYFLCCLVGLKFVTMSSVNAEMFNSQTVNPETVNPETLNSATLNSETLRVGFYPYSRLMTEKTETGIYYDILKKVFVITGITFEIFFTPGAHHQATF